MTTILTTRRDTNGNRRLRDRIAGGELTTWEFRQWCAGRDIEVSQAVFYPGHPLPFALHSPMQCRVCGWVAETEWLDNAPDAGVCTLEERFSEPQHSEPAEYEPICVQCGAINPFSTMTVCDECKDYPCTCSAEDAT